MEVGDDPGQWGGLETKIRKCPKEKGVLRWVQTLRRGQEAA